MRRAPKTPMKRPVAKAKPLPKAARKDTLKSKSGKGPLEPQPVPKVPDATQTSPDGLEAALKQCRKAARRGHKIAKENLQEAAKAIDRVLKSFSRCLKTLDDGSVRTPGIVDLLKRQLSGVVDELDQVQRTADCALEEHRQRLDKFSVTLFGRTMAGKSTLMEILTRGDGKSIGTGAQRTTRDVRSYPWNELEVTDVPGVAAFGGEADEELAFQAASQADLVLFLITDDAPQPVEAECLALLRRMGKPVLGICNVKVAVDDADDLLLFLRNPDRPFDQARLDELRNQFHALVEQHAPGQRVPFSFTHLRSRFLAEQPQFAVDRELLMAASRFEGIESKIVGEVVGRGTFLRVKSFVDAAVVPMTGLTDLLLEFSVQNASSGQVLTDKRRQFEEWSQEFRKHGQERISTLVSKAMDTLRDEVPTFAEDHCEDASAGESWRKLVESMGVNRKVNNLQKELLHDCNQALSEVSRELKSELSLGAGLVGDRQIKMDSIFNLKRAWNWSTLGLSGGLTLAAYILAGTPIGWALGTAALIVGIGGWIGSRFMHSRETKAKRARKKLTDLLFRNIDKMEEDLRQSLKDWLHQELFGRQLDVVLNDLDAVKSQLFKLADAQRTLAWKLNDRQKALARTLVEEALRQLKAGRLKSSLTDVARIPGVAAMFLIAPNATFPERIRDGLKRLLGEEIWLVADARNRLTVLIQAVGQDWDSNKIRIEEKSRVVHVPLDDLGATAKARMRVAQQLTGLHVMR